MGLIDAHKLYEQYETAMRELVKSTNCENIGLEALSLLCGANLIANAPTVDAAPVVHGRWISDEAYGHIKVIDGVPNGSCICSVCGKWLTGSDEYDVYGNYCPACGAKMDLDEDHTGQKTEIESHLYNEDEAADNMRDYCERYEPTYNTEDGSM